MPRFRTSIVLAMMLITTYIRFSRTYIPHSVRMLQENLGYTSSGWGSSVHHDSDTNESDQEVLSAQEELLSETDPPTQYSTFDEEYEALGQQGSADLIFGNTISHLVDTHECTATSLEPLKLTDSSKESENTIPCRYNPYPKYNSKEWKTSNQGAYVECAGPEGHIEDMLVFPGHHKALEDAPMGSDKELGINSNLCFERKTRLGPYGYVDEEGDDFLQSLNVSQSRDWDTVNWGNLQKQCFQKNEERYRKAENNKTKEGNHGKDMRGVKEQKAKRGTRTALLLRAYTGMSFTEDEKQNIRALVTELSLKSGGEYEVFLLVQLKDDNFKIEGNNKAYHDAIETYIPKEFWDMSVLWTDHKMRRLYSKIPDEYQNVHRSQWFSVQNFAQDYPDFDYFWNWELDSRYTGNHYDLLEKLGKFGAAQPRRGLWERNNRYYIPKVHGAYNSTFRKQVDKIYGSSTVWGAPSIPDVNPIGPAPPTSDPRDDAYSWGVDEEADYISLAPIFNPQTSGWIDQNMMSGYQGAESTPRRSTIGTQSRCSKKLLDIMHQEDQRGNHVSSEMTPQTVAFHHGLKAVYAPIPMWFDREWDARNLNKWFNPGEDGDSGGGGNASPFSWGGEGKFSGSTWYYRAISPMRLWNNFLGWEDTGVGGSEWEKTHGRTCLPSMLLHPIKDVEKPPPGFVSKSPLPY